MSTRLAPAPPSVRGRSNRRKIAALETDLARARTACPADFWTTWAVARSLEDLLTRVGYGAEAVLYAEIADEARRLHDFVFGRRHCDFERFCPGVVDANRRPTRRAA